MNITPAHERILRRVDTTDPAACWRFLGAKSIGGYGVARRSNRREDGNVYAHRAVYEAQVGPIPEGLFLDHLCRVRDCVNPSHLEPVTGWENVQRSTNDIGRNPSKTHCPQGHPYDEANTYHYGTARQCRICRDAHRAAWRERSGQNLVRSQSVQPIGGGSHA